MLLKHGRAFPGKTTWGARHHRWLAEQAFDHAAQQIVLQELIVADRHAKERLERIEAAVVEFIPQWSLAPLVEALQALRGMRLPTAVTIAAEIGDLGRFDSARQFMGYLGLMPGERSTGETVRRLGITKAGWADPASARRERLDLPSCAACWHPQTLPAAGRLHWGARHRSQGRGTALRPVPCSLGTQQEADGGRHCDRARARRVHLGDREGGEDRVDATHRRYGHRAGQGWGRGNGRGSPVGRFVAGLTDARSKIGNAPDA